MMYGFLKNMISFILINGNLAFYKEQKLISRDMDVTPFPEGNIIINRVKFLEIKC